MVGGPARVFLAIFGFALLSGCAEPPPPLAVPSVTPMPDCEAETVVTQVSYHNWTLTEQTVANHEFTFENLTKLSFKLTLSGDLFVQYLGEPPELGTNWFLAGPDGRSVWSYSGSGGGVGNPAASGKTTSVRGEWTNEELGRITGTWIVHLDGRSNAQGIIEMVGTSTPCAVTEFTETVVEE